MSDTARSGMFRPEPGREAQVSMDSTKPADPGPDGAELYRALALIRDGLLFGLDTRDLPPDPAGTISHEPGTASGAASDHDPDPETALSALREEALACTSCALAAGRTRVVFGEGVPNPLVLVIGEGPGAEEDSQGLPFVGASGKLLDRMLAAIGLSRRENCYIANIVKCRPPNNREPAPDERAACMPFLRGQIRLLSPRVILCAGRTAAQSLLASTDGINKLRTTLHEYQGIPVVATYHPSALLRDESLKRPAWEDLKRLRELMDTGAA